MPHPKGPVGILIAEIIRIDARLDEDMNIHIPKEQPIPLLQLPFQYLAPTVQLVATRARTHASQYTKSINKGLHEIDNEATRSDDKDMSEEQKRRIAWCERQGKQHFTAQGRVEEVSTLFCKREAECKTIKVSGLEDNMVGDMIHQLPWKNSSRDCETCPGTLHGPHEGSKFMEHREIGVPEEA